MGSDSELTIGGRRSTRRLIIHAPNIHTGGGAKLLNALLCSWQEASELVLICDRRMFLDPSIDAAVAANTIEPQPFARLVAERKLRNLAQSGDVVLAFGNLPPLFRLNAQTVLFVQNRYLVDPAMSLRGFRISAKIRLCMERLWLKKRLCNVDRVIVQTSSMCVLFEKAFGRRAEVMPMSPTRATAAMSSNGAVAVEGRYDFVYVSSGEPHKNHRSLIEAWILLALGGIKPSLALTLSEENNAELVALLAEANASFGTKITNLGDIPSEGVDAVYEASTALVFPSLGESLGLPLLEALERGLPVLASELDYVRDLIDPAETFDPRSPRSIARAVCRFLKLPPDRTETLGPVDFLRRICPELY